MSQNAVIKSKVSWNDFLAVMICSICLIMIMRHVFNVNQYGYYTTNGGRESAVNQLSGCFIPLS